MIEMGTQMELKPRKEERGKKQGKAKSAISCEGEKECSLLCPNLLLILQTFPYPKKNMKIYSAFGLTWIPGVMNGYGFRSGVAHINATGIKAFSSFNLLDSKNCRSSSLNLLLPLLPIPHQKKPKIPFVWLNECHAQLLENLLLTLCPHQFPISALLRAGIIFFPLI
jgi:hypothetical protein